MKRILLFSTLSPYPYWAGSETYWFDLVLDPRSRERFEFNVRLADSPVTRQKALELKEAGAAAEFYPHYNSNFLRRNIARLRDRAAGRQVRKLPWYDAILREKWDLVWLNVDGLHNLGDVEYAVELCRQAGVPYWILLQHGYEDFFVDDAERLEVYRRIAKGAKRFVFIAERNRAALERAIAEPLQNAFHSRNALPAAKIELAGSHMSHRPPGSSTTAEFFNLGRFSPKDKGQHLILEALSREAWRERDWRLSFIGVSGFGKEYLQQLANFLRIEAGRIEFVSFTDDVFAEIAKRDVLLMPSLAEGTPYAMIESMACGRPAVGTPVGGIPEMVRKGSTGWLARTTDVGDIADAMEKMWSSREEWQRFGENARDLVAASHNEETVYAEVLELLEVDSTR